MRNNILMRQIREKLVDNDKFFKFRSWKLFYQGVAFSLIAVASPSLASYEMINQGAVAKSQLISYSSANVASASHSSNTSVSANDDSSLKAFSVSQAVTYSSHINFGGYVSSDNPKASGQLGLFVPVWQNVTQLFFVDSSLYDSSRSPFEGNLSLGYRFMPNPFKKKMLLGAFLGYDRVRSESANYFNQFSFGTEFWRNRLFLGSHLYIPFGSRNKADPINNLSNTTPTNSAGYSHIVYQEGREVILPGIELQAGYNIWHGLSVFAGPYYYKSSDVPTVWGPKIRALYQWDAKPGRRILGVMNRIGIETQFEHDKPRGSNWYVGVRASIDIASHGNQKFTDVQSHMIDSLRHEYNATTLRYLATPQTYSINGRAANVSFVNNLTQLNAAISDSGTDIIAINGTIDGIDRILIGSDRSIAMTGGDFRFTVGGESYTAHNLGHNGVLQQSQGSSGYLIGIEGDNDITLENLGLNVVNASNGFANNAILDNTSTGGTLTFNGVTSNGALLIELTNPDQSVNVVFENNHFITNAGPIGNNSTRAAVAFIASGGSTINVTDFTNNQVINKLLSPVGVGGDILAGLVNNVSSGGTINYTGPVTNNIISLTSEQASQAALQPSSYYAMHNQATGNSSTINFNGAVANNKFTLAIPNAPANLLPPLGANIENYAENQGTINFFAGFNNNTLDIDNAFVQSIITQSISASVGLDTLAAAGGTVNYSQILGNSVLSGTNKQDVGFYFDNNSGLTSGTIIVGEVTNSTDFAIENNSATVDGGDNVSDWDS